MSTKRWLALSMPKADVERLFDRLLAEDPSELYRRLPLLDEVHWPLLLEALATCPDVEARMLLAADSKSRLQIARFLAVAQQRGADPGAVLKTLKSELSQKKEVLAACMAALQQGDTSFQVTLAHLFAAVAVHGSSKQHKALRAVPVPDDGVDWMRAVCERLPRDRALPFGALLKHRVNVPQAAPRNYVRRFAAPVSENLRRPHQLAAPAEALAAVYAAPLRDGPRAVLADHLLEHHEPLGELIQLQLSRAAGRRGTLERERQLFETYKHALWPDHPVGIAQTHLKFSDVERGFPSYFGARGELDVQLHDRLAKHPGWSTIETYRSWPEVSLAEMLPDAMPSLKKLLDVSLELLDAVRARVWPVEELSLTSDQGKTRPVTGLKQLRKLSVGSDHGLETAIENLGPSSLLHQVTHLEVFTPHASMATILEALSKLPRQLSSLYSAGITLTRGRKGIEAQLHAESSTLDDRLRQLEAIPARALASVHLVLDTNGFFTPKTRPVAEAASRLEAHVGAPSVVSLRPRDTHLVILTDR